jgi:Zn-dependent protease with chaperone function
VLKRLLAGFWIACLLASLAGAAWATLHPGPPPSPGPPLTQSLDEAAIRRATVATPRQREYSALRVGLYFVGTAAGMGAMLLLLARGFSAALRDRVEARIRHPLLQAGVFYPLITLSWKSLLLPLGLFSAYTAPKLYGLSTQTPLSYARDWLMSWGVAALIGPFVVTLLLWTIRRSPRRWWLGFWLALIPLIFTGTYLTPLVYDPLFNRIEPLKNTALRERILSVAASAGIPHSDVYQMDAGKRTRAVNAYVTGLGGSARIVLWDTLFDRLSEDEIIAVVAHEMGHYVENHILTGVLLSLLGSLAVLWLAARLGRWAVVRWGPRWKLRSLDDLAAVPLFLLLMAVLNFAGSPLENAVSRRIESRADVFGLRHTHNGLAEASSLLRLGESNLSDPDPPKWVVYTLFTHPPLKERIERALSWGSERTKASSGN